MASTSTEAKTRTPHWGGNCPAPDQLQTGDLLFPRKPMQPEHQIGWGAFWISLLDAEQLPTGIGLGFGAKIGDILEHADAGEMRDLLKRRLPDGTPDFSGLAGYTPDPTRLSRGQSPDKGIALMRDGVPGAAAAHIAQTPVYESLLLRLGEQGHPLSLWSTNPAQAASIPGPDDPDFLLAMLAILRIEFPHLIDKWLDMTVNEFVRSDIGQFFIDALTSPDPSLSFFVGHVAIVLREKDGRSVNGTDGTVYVVEANITDYAHYRVSIHPYHSDRDPLLHGASGAAADESASLMNGWVNRRCAMGEYVWHARPRLDAYGDAWKTPLLQACKQLLGRPYGFFDHPDFGDDDRMYCAEYVYRAFKDIDAIVPGFAENLRDKQTWSGMQEYLNVSRQKKQHKLVTQIMKAQKIAGSEPFFVLPPPLLWNSTALTREANPSFANRPYAPSM